MPIHLPAISRRQFLVRSLAGAAWLTLGPELLAATKPTDPDSWALLSDIHIAADPALVARKINMTDHLTQVSQEVLALPKRPAGVFITGDCAYNTGQIADYAHVTDLLEPIRKGDTPVHLTLGNHDNRERFWEALQKEKAAKRPLADRQVALIRTPRANWFVLDSLEKTLSTPGVLGQEQLDWLASALDANPTKPALVLIHHNPGLLASIGGLKDSEALFAVIRPRKQVKAYIFGHTHFWNVYEDPSGIHLINLPPVAYVFLEGQPSGWVHATLEDEGMRLECRCLDATHPAHAQVHNLRWRAQPQMRVIGHLTDETAARTFGDYLYVQGIENNIELHKPEGWAVWVNDEDKIEQATGLLAAFRQNPNDPKYRAEGKGAAALREKEEKGETAYVKKVRDRHQLFRPLAAYGFGPLTFVLIVISVVVAIYSRLGAAPEAIMRLFITDYTVEGNLIAWSTTLPEIRHGEVWRLITPIFIHFGLLHIFFNMLWLRDLGSMIENRQGSWVLALLVLIIAAGSNLAQFYYGGRHFHPGGPDFGGMSGVVYGLLGYIWIRGKFDPGSGLFVHSYTVTMMIIWFFACFTPLVPSVANGTHAAGLIMGMAWGYLSSLRYR